jgi:hypothetical protein
MVKLAVVCIGTPLRTARVQGTTVLGSAVLGSAVLGGEVLGGGGLTMSLGRSAITAAPITATAPINAAMMATLCPFRAMTWASGVAGTFDVALVSGIVSAPTGEAIASDIVSFTRAVKDALIRRGR